MRAPLRYIPLLLLAGLFWACGGDRALQVSLDRADALMEAHPDSALALLKPYDGAQIRSEAQRARFALLYSMALDKNYIDIDSLTVLQPALDYYPTHGTYADKIRTLYYAGRIYENAGHMEKAMEVWAEGLLYCGPKTDSLVLGHLLVAQGNEYFRLYQFDKFVDNNRQAEEIYRSLGRKDFADKAFLYQFELALNRNSEFAIENISRVTHLALDSLSPNAVLARSKALQYEMHFGTLASLDSRLREYEGLKMDRIVLTQTLLNLGRISEAENVFQSVQPGTDTQISYLLKKMRIEKAKGNFEEALKSSEQVLKTFDQEQSAAIEGDAQYAEERFQWRSAVEKHKKAEIKALFFGIITFSLLVIAVVVFIYRYRMNRKKQEERIASLLSEQDMLKEHLDIISSPELRDAIYRRLVLLKQITDEKENKCTKKELDKLLEKRAKFMRDSRLALTASHPNFVTKLKSCGLDDEELDYACLYAIGMSGKEVGEYLKKASHYRLSGQIRAKLGYGKYGPVLRTLIKDMMEKSGDF